MATKKRLLCDTNFLLDIFDAERAHHLDAIALLWFCSGSEATAEPIASITSFKDAYYVLHRLYKDEKLARKSIEDVMGTLVEPIDMLSNYGAEALASDKPDFEDGLIRACAEHENAATIITRDKSAFANCAIPAMPAGDFLAQEGFDYDLIDW